MRSTFFTLDPNKPDPTIKSLVLKSNAKLNLGLRILGRRPEDGYHLLETIFQEIDLADEIKIEEKNRRGFFNDRFKLSCNIPEIPTDENNLVMKAILEMTPYLPVDFGADIYLEKKIPSGAGLGGGSSNAASILKWLNEKAQLKEKELLDIATFIGADVPFFLKGGSQYATGIGDELTQIEIPKNWCAVLVFPKIHISTPWAYKQLKKTLTEKEKKAIIPSQLKNEFNWQLFENEFDNAIIPSYPEIGKIKERLLESGAIYAALSGSGSTVFGICESCAIAKKILQVFESACIAYPI